MTQDTQVDLISDRLHREWTEAKAEVLWLALDARPVGSTAEQGGLLEALQARSAVEVRVPHGQVDAALRPRWYGLSPDQPADSALLRLSVEHALLEVQPERLRQGGGRVVAGWFVLRRDASPDRAAMVLGRHMVQRRLGRDMLLRLHDPAVRWWLWRFLEDAQRAALLGAAAAWWLLDPVGELDVLTPSAVSGDLDLLLTDEQWSDVLGIAALNKVLREIAPLHEDRLAREPRVELMMQALRDARAHGWNEPGDVALFIQHALSVHPRFATHPLVRELLERREPDDFYGGLVADLGEAEWNIVRRDCELLEARPT